MRLENSFEIPLPPEQAWRILRDVRRIAPCMPGAEITEVIDDCNYRGKVSVKLGPVALTFIGKAQFVAINESERTATVRAQGSDSKGRGGAAATVVFRIEPSPGGSSVIVETDMTLNGSVAQYGRGAGMIQALAGQLMGQFATSLGGQLALEEAAAPVVAGKAAIEAMLETRGIAPPATAISGFGLLAAVIRGFFAGLFRGRGKVSP